MAMTRVRRRILAGAAAVALLAAPLATVSSADAKPNPPAKPVTVMTRNLYLGADINRPVEAAQRQAAQTPTRPDLILGALANATFATRAIVDQTDFRVRAGLLAEEIAVAAPDLVGLQEVALWRSGPLQLAPGLVTVPNAQDVDYDFLALLLDALAAHGAHYTAVSVAQRADVESPSFSGAPTPASRDIRLTMHDVILMRVGDSLTVLDEGQQEFAENLQVGIAGLAFDFARGYQWVDVRAGAQRFRFVNTHLEAFSSNIAYDQAAQLLEEATAPDRSTVFVCDCNSDPVNGTIKAHDTRAHWEPYRLITGPEGGYTDEWKAFGRPADRPGFDAGDTSGLNERVNESAPGSWTHRIDMIFGRTADGGGLKVDRGQVTGRDGDPRDPATGLWPSDHAGVVLRLRGL